MKGAALLDTILTRSTMEVINASKAPLSAPTFLQEIMAVCFQWTSDAHLEVDSDIFRLPIFQKTLYMTGSKFGTPGLDSFKKLLTCIFLCCNLKLSTHVLTDSDLSSAADPGHSSAAVITRPPEIICVCRIPIGHNATFVLFDSHPRPQHPRGAAFIVTTSIDLMASEILDLLALDSNLLTDTSLQWQAQLLANFSAHFFKSRSFPDSKAEVTQAILDSSLQVLALRAQVSDLQSQVQLHKSISERFEAEVEQWEEKYRKQLKIQGKQRQSSHSSIRSLTSSPAAGPSKAPYWETARTPSRNPQSTTGEDHNGIAMLMQLQYDEENLRLAEERESLRKRAQVLFDCGICFEQLPQDDMVTVHPCRHSFCRSCARQHILARLREHRFPIFCPSCTTGTNQSGRPSLLTPFCSSHVS